MIFTCFSIKSSIAVFCLFTMISCCASERRELKRKVPQEKLDEDFIRHKYPRYKENFNNAVQNTRYYTSDIPQSRIGCYGDLTLNEYFKMLSWLTDKNDPNDIMYDVAPFWMRAYAERVSSLTEEQQPGNKENR